MSDKLLTVKQAAEALGLSKRTLFRWLDAGRFPGARKIPGRLGGEWRIPAGDLDGLEARPAPAYLGEAPICQGTRKDGQPCQSPALTNSDYCRWHQK